MSHQPEESTDFVLVQVCKLHRARAHALLEALGLYQGQPPMLRALWQEDGQSHTALAERLHVQPATMTKMVQRMEKAGFVERRADPRDQRRSRVYLTDAGRAVRDEVGRVWRVLEEETLAGFTPEERIVLHGLLVRMRENLIQAEGAAHCSGPGNR